MGNMTGSVLRNGKTIDVGYGVSTTCEHPRCTETIDRGLAYLCGSTHGGDEHSCGGYFCGQHLYMAPEGHLGGRCILCRDNGADPTEGSPDAMVVSFASQASASVSCQRCKGDGAHPECHGAGCTDCDPDTGNCPTCCGTGNDPSRWQRARPTR